ncbi:MAG: phosphatidate cytidylyltransferase [Syntrophaceae bacterium]|nr:phosphatidate cytidylyltransferase [Syntrophaceae bacterium]
MKTSHLQRWITAVIAVPLLFLLVFKGSAAVFAFLIAAVIIMAAWEYEGIIISVHQGKRRLEFLLSTLLFPISAYLKDMALLIISVVFVTIIFILCDLFRTSKEKKSPDIELLAKYILGIIYIPLLMSHFILVRGLEEGVFWIFYILVIAFAGDAAAFYTGKFFGKNKLCPYVSPNKTVEGVLGLVLAAVIAAGTYGHFCLPDVPFSHIIILAFLTSIIGQLGDLFESEIKRSSGVKDSGNILPGHGGMMDRIDCLLFMVPFVYYYRFYMLG